jgi:phage FluMu protein Com
MESSAPTAFSTSIATKSRLRWREMRCLRCARLLQKVEENALRPGKRLEIKCGHCKVMNYLVGVETVSTIPVGQEP